ncbi:protease Lon-related BREX system protein BrxL [Gemmatimonadota bacterium]
MTSHSDSAAAAGGSGLDALDRKANDVFAGKVVRKDLVRKVKVGANVPVFVLEYLLGKYCASDNDEAIRLGMEAVEKTLRENYVRPDEANRAQSMVREKGTHRFIDKVKVKYHSSEDKYWAELTNFGHAHVHVPEIMVHMYDRLLLGGVWAQVDIRHMYDETATGKVKSPFWIEELKPIQLATFSFEDYVRGRAKFTTDEWLDLVLRSLGFETSHFDHRLKLLFLSRLIPMCERNFNFVELGPRGTGKSFMFQEISPYTILLTGTTTVARLFYNISRREVGLVGKWDAIGFDEVADLEKMDKEVVTTLKTYCESGRFARDRETLEGHASLAMFGNTNQPIDVMVRSSHLFMPMPAVIRDDMAFLDRLHFYLPGWEVPKMRNEYFTDHYGFVVDYLAEALRHLREANYTDRIDHYFDFGSQLNTRDVKAVRKTVSGFLKILHPSGECLPEEMEEYVSMALEARRRVKEQLKKLGGFEYSQTSFSYIDQETREERFVGVPEEGGRDLIAMDPLPPGMVYAASVSVQGKVGLYRLEIGTSAGTGKLTLSGGLNTEQKESIRRAFDYAKAHKVQLGFGPALDSTDFHAQVVDLLNRKEGSELGVAFFVAMYSALQRQSSLSGLVVLGDMTIGGNAKPVQSLIEPLQIIQDNGGRRALIPIENKRHFLEVDAEIMEHVDPIFYSDPIMAARKGLGVG